MGRLAVYAVPMDRSVLTSAGFSLAALAIGSCCPGSAVPRRVQDSVGVMALLEPLLGRS